MITVINFDQGDEIPNEYLGMPFWSPNLGALLLSGIFPSSPKRQHPFDKVMFDPVAHLPPFDLIDFHTFEIDGRRAKRYRHFLDQWLEAHYDINQAYPPRTFLEWYEKIKHITLDHSGKPITPPTLLSLPEPASPPQYKHVHRIENKSDLIGKIIADCQKGLDDPADYLVVWEKLIELAENPLPNSILKAFIPGKGIQYKQDGKLKILSKSALRKRLNPSARGPNKKGKPSAS